MNPDFDDISFITDRPVDKIISDFDGTTTTHSVAAATLSGGFYLPKTDTLQVPNPAGRKCAITLRYSIDGENFYPAKPRLYQPGNPVPTGALGAVVGATVSDTHITFMFTHYYGVQVDFTIFWVLHYLEGTDGTNYEVQEPVSSDSGIMFTTAKNYMKHAPTSGYDTMLGPNVSTGFGYIRDYVVGTGLNRASMIRVDYEPFNDGRIMEAYFDSQGYFSDPINTYGGTEDAPVIFSKVDATTLTITLGFPDATKAAEEFPIYWTIYNDYGLGV